MTKPLTANSPELGRSYDNTRMTESDRIRDLSTLDKLRYKRILVVDDNPDIAFTLRIGLEDNDTTVQVHSYDNPVNALLDFKPNFYDLLLVDVNMQLMDGFELCKKLLQKDINVKVCFMTAGELNMDAVREVHPLKSIGCFIKKPITMDALVKRIKAELD
ncbi:MAG: response regulator [Nitrososphaeraceae archaeon]|jgi:DNA-binding response OmpR family regulator